MVSDKGGLRVPELPEVEIVRQGLDSILPGKTIQHVDFDWPKSFPNSLGDVQRFLLGAHVASVRRRAKVLLIELSSGYTLMIHLKMTGQLVFVSSQTGERFGAGHPNESLVSRLPDTSTRVTLTFSDESRLFFNDQRKFGWAKLLSPAALEQDKFLLSVGPEPLEEGFTADVFIERLRRHQGVMIKAGLLNQYIIAGIGNIYADESLWGAQLHPERRVASISDEEIRQLYAEVRAILTSAIAAGGSTDKTYVNAKGEKGSYLSIARVFRREGQPCPRCQEAIRKIRVAGRGTHLCMICQRMESK